MERRFHIAGWILFILSAVGFIISSAVNHDDIALAASVLFLVACVAFMIPLFRS